jgi:hypothetical protein
MMRIKTKKLPSIWDYDISKIDLSKPEIAKWYLERRINYADWEGLEYKLLKKYLPELEIEPYTKAILSDFIKTYEKTSS